MLWFSTLQRLSASNISCARPLSFSSRASKLLEALGCSFSMVSRSSDIGGSRGGILFNDTLSMKADSRLEVDGKSTKLGQSSVPSRMDSLTISSIKESCSFAMTAPRTLVALLESFFVTFTQLSRTSVTLSLLKSFVFSVNIQVFLSN
uniref:Secreted protein n=1 Tax=Pyxicephalus adspersus TaxID=30357 RepID=A0AAV2ZP22_PYXAD|nr:TPA: hypothetical protein GDO54_015767 [Pyxicephalus adspersus]